MARPAAEPRVADGRRVHACALRAAVRQL